MRKSFLGSLFFVLLGIAITGWVDNVSAQAPAQPAPQQPAAAPAGQPAAAPAVPGQPAAAPAVPGQPVAAPVVPGQPAAASGVPAQPAAAPGVPAQPTAAPAVPAQPVIAPPTPTGDVLVDKLNSKKYEVAPQMVPTSALLKQALAKGKSQAYTVQLYGPPYCQTFVATAADTVKNIDLVLESPTGAREAVDNMDGSVAAIANHCPAMPGIYKLTVSMAGDGGDFAVQVFSK